MQIKRQPQPQHNGNHKIWLNHTTCCLVDFDDYEKLKHYRWRLRMSSHCFYAVRRLHINGKAFEIKMHRVIAKTPPGYECHHINKKTLDNRKANLQNLAPNVHSTLHATQLAGKPADGVP